MNKIVAIWDNKEQIKIELDAQFKTVSQEVRNVYTDYINQFF
jgi:hypothetical protein